MSPLQAARRASSSTSITSTEEGSPKQYGFTNIVIDGVIASTTGIRHPVTITADANAPAYNLIGQRIGNNYHGIVIRNGKKSNHK